MVQMSVDNDEKIEKTCGKCKSHMEQERCQSCGEKVLTEKDLNPNFDEAMFEKLKSQSNIGGE